MRVAIIGCGGIGMRRGAAVEAVEGASITIGVDVVEENARKFGERFGCEYGTDWEAAVDRDDVDLVVVATANNAHAPVSIQAMDSKKHVLCEKPLARNPVECMKMVQAAKQNGVKLKTGFNHRYSHQTWKAYELFEEGAIGDVIFARGRTGHGQGEALSKRWFGNYDLSGGGTFLDNGVHLLDLSRWFMGDFVEATGYVHTHLPALGKCEDNGFGIYKTADGRICQLQSSWTQWKGYLFLEVFGDKGELLINYDDQTCTLIRRGAETSVWQFAGLPDLSWQREIEEMRAAIQEDREPLANGYDGWQAVRMAYGVYESSQSGRAVAI
ncbi:MAG TPA: Gfo/Idh/MocA family oxidoreductase [Armatimonadota bacterium]|nr:Gfo/Idh/MocA family oxidoreductase [Armatimonadota bacterium]